MYEMLEPHKMLPKTKEVFDMIDSLNLAFIMLEEPKINYDMIKSNQWQSICGQNFRINIMKHGGIKFVYKVETKNYKDIEKASNALEILDIRVHKIIDTGVNPAVATYTIDIPNNEYEFRYLAKILELVKIS